MEVPSTTSEYFMRDPEYLFEKAVPVNGQKPTLAQFTEWVKNSSRSDALSLTGRASQALYDIEITIH